LPLFTNGSTTVNTNYYDYTGVLMGVNPVLSKWTVL